MASTIDLPKNFYRILVLGTQCLTSNSMDIAMENFVFSMDTTKGKGIVKGRGSTSSQHNSNWNQDTKSITS